MSNKYSVVGFLAREHGIDGLNALIGSKSYNPVCIFTHRRKATFEDQKRSEREDFSKYCEITGSHSIPLYAIDSKKDMSLIDEILDQLNFDLIAAISWRRLIPEHHLEIPKIGGVNIHRGKFPEYIGDKPVVRALQDNQKQVYITAHILTKEIDAGEILTVQNHQVNYDESKSLDENVERVKKELTPYFGHLLTNALDKIVEKYERKQ